MNARHFAAFAAGIFACASLPAQAVVIDFEELAFDGSTNEGPRGISSPLNIGGFTITASDPFGLPPILVYGRQSTNNPDFGGASIFPNRTNTGLTITKAGGGTFTFNSVDLTFAFDDQNFAGSGGLATYSFDGGASTQTRAFDNLAGFQTFAFNTSGLTSLQITADNAFAIDNLVLDAAAVVPEPATWAMMIGGAGMIGGAMRRRRRQRMTMTFA